MMMMMMSRDFPIKKQQLVSVSLKSVTFHPSWELKEHIAVVCLKVHRASHDEGEGFFVFPCLSAKGGIVPIDHQENIALQLLGFRKVTTWMVFFLFLNFLFPLCMLKARASSVEIVQHVVEGRLTSFPSGYFDRCLPLLRPCSIEVDLAVFQQQCARL